MKSRTWAGGAIVAVGLGAAIAVSTLSAQAGYRRVHSMRCSLEGQTIDAIEDGHYTVVNGALGTGVQGISLSNSYFYCPVPESNTFLGKDINTATINVYDATNAKSITAKGCAKTDFSSAYACGSAVQTGTLQTGAVSLSLTDFSAWPDPGLGFARRRYVYLGVPEQASGAVLFSRIINVTYYTP